MDLTIERFLRYHGSPLPARVKEEPSSPSCYRVKEEPASRPVCHMKAEPASPVHNRGVLIGRHAKKEPASPPHSWYGRIHQPASPPGRVFAARP